MAGRKKRMTHLPAKNPDEAERKPIVVKDPSDPRDPSEADGEREVAGTGRGDEEGAGRGPDRSARTSKPRKAGVKREKRKGPTNLSRHNDAKSIVAKEKAKEIVALRLQGYTLREIAEKVGFSHSGVGFALDREMKAPVPGAIELKRNLLQEITIVREGLMRDFVRVGDRLVRTLDDPDAGPDGISKLVGARNGTAARIIAAHERLARLDGLDTPAETIVSGSVDVTHTDRSADSLMTALERIATDMRARKVLLPPPPIDVVVQDCSGPNAPEHQPDEEPIDAGHDDDEPL